MTTTPAALLNLALLDSGVIGQGQTASAADINNAFTRYGMMISQWAQKRWLVYALQDVSFTSTGAVSYTIGTGQNFDTPRPDRLEDGCFMRQQTGGPQPVDYIMRLCQSHEEYNRIRIKSMGTFPSLVFYDSAYPVGNVYFWPVPQSGYQLHVLVKTPIANAVTLADTILLPDEYQEAIFYNMICRLRAAYRLPADPVFVGLARSALETVRASNTQMPTLRIPRAAQGRGGLYNIFSDTVG